MGPKTSSATFPKGASTLKISRGPLPYSFGLFLAVQAQQQRHRSSTSFCGQASLLHFASCSAKCPRQQAFLVERPRNPTSSSILKISSCRSTGIESMIVFLQRLLSIVLLPFLDETVPLKVSGSSASLAFEAAIGSPLLLIQRR